MAGQHKGVQSSNALRSNSIAQTLGDTNQEARAIGDQELRVSYGEIVEVDEGSSRVRVNIFNRGSDPIRIGAKDNNKDGIFVPILQPIHVVHLLFGALRKGLLVRVFWRGKRAPASEAIVEIISDLSFNELKAGSQGPRSNELATGPHDLFTGGVNA